MEYKLKKMFNFKLIGIGIIFLADYNIGVIDIFPDLTGLVLILVGIGRIAYVNDDFGKASHYIKIWIGIAAAKLILTAAAVVTAAFNDSDMLMFAMLFGVCDLIFSFAVFRHIFSGCDIFLNFDNQFGNLRKLSYLLPVMKSFFAVKFMLTVISQLPLLLSEKTYDYLSVKYNTYFTLKMIKDFLLPPCFLVVTLFGLLVVSLIIPFFYSVSRSETLQEIIRNKVNHLFINNRFFILKKSFDTAFALFAAGLVFCVDIEFDNVNFLPDFMIYVFLMCGMKILGRQEGHPRDKRLKLYTVVGFISSLATYIFTTAYRSGQFNSSVGTSTTFMIISAVLSILTGIYLFSAVSMQFIKNIRKIQEYHLNFSRMYLANYISPAETDTGIGKKQKIQTALTLGIAATAKILSHLLGNIDTLDIGIYKFFVSVILISFVICATSYIYKIKNYVFSYYT